MKKLHTMAFAAVISIGLLSGICVSQEKKDDADRSARIQELIKKLGVNNKNVRVDAIQDLIKLKAKEAIPEVKKLLKDEDSSVCSNAALFLGVMGVKDVIPELKELLKDRSWQVRSGVVTALGELGAKEVIPEIKELLKDESWYVRSSAVGVLGKFGVKEVIPEIKELLKDKYVCGWAGIALVELGAKEDVPKEIIKNIKNVLEARISFSILSVYKEDANRAENALRQLGVSDKEIEETKDVEARRKIGGNEQDAIGSLKQLVSHEATWQRVDEDGNAIKDYYTFDVAGLHYHTNTLGAKLQYIDIKFANADPSVTNWDKDAKHEPCNGYYFKAIVKDGNGNNYNENLAVRAVGPIKVGTPIANSNRYGFCAYPAVYGKTGKFTFIVNQAGVRFKKDTGGKPIDQWPSKEGEKLEDGWEKVE